MQVLMAHRLGGPDSAGQHAGRDDLKAKEPRSKVGKRSEALMDDRSPLEKASHVAYVPSAWFSTGASRCVVRVYPSAEKRLHLAGNAV